MAERDAGVPDDQRIQFRIGVNLGDVIIEGDDIYGDGVNIAARLEGLAEPGGIVISGTAFDHAKNKPEAGFGFRAASRSRTSPSRCVPTGCSSTRRRLVDPRRRERQARWRWPALAAAAALLVVPAPARSWAGCARGKPGARSEPASR